MPVWLKPFARILQRIAFWLDQLRFKIKKRLGWARPPIILPYRGFGNKSEIYLRGRVLEDNGLAKPANRDSIWYNIVAMYKRYVSNEIANVRIKATFEGLEQIVTTSEVGFFEVTFKFPEPLPTTDNWVEVELVLLDQVVPRQGTVTAKCPVMLAQDKHKFGIISDVDDTILISNATNFYKKIKLMILKNARTRLPFEGVAGFYQALQKGNSGQCFNPIFYVSSSSWNLYDLLVDFCSVQGIPRGPFLLRDSRLDQFKFFSSIHVGHKLRKIKHILTTYQQLRFILIGDSGQKDAEIYSQIIRDYPGRVLAVYIRDVSLDARDEAVRSIAATLVSSGVEMLLVKDTEEAARHAIKKGYIAPHQLSDVQKHIEKDQQAPTDMEQLMSKAKS